MVLHNLFYKQVHIEFHKQENFLHKLLFATLKYSVLSSATTYSTHNNLKVLYINIV